MKVVSEVLLQRTTAKAVAEFLPRFIAQFPSWESLAQADEMILASALRPLGLWRRRAASLRALAKEIAINGGRVPRKRAEIEHLSGVGQYIANAIELFAAGARKPLLDSNMARVLERFYGPRSLADIRYDPGLQKIAHEVVADGDPKVINWAILDLASAICKVRKPLCDECPLRARCRYYGVYVAPA